MNSKREKQKGFTLVELLAVIVVLAIILAIAIPSVLGVINNSKDGSFRSSARMMVSSAKTVVASKFGIDIPTKPNSLYVAIQEIEMDFEGKTPYGDSWDKANSKVYVTTEGDATHKRIVYYVSLGTTGSNPRSLVCKEVDIDNEENCKIRSGALSSNEKYNEISSGTAVSIVNLH